MNDVSSNEIIIHDFTFPDGSTLSELMGDVSSNEVSNANVVLNDVHVNNVDSDILNEIKVGVKDIKALMTINDTSLPTVHLNDDASGIDGYNVIVNGQRVFIPVDRVQYISRTDTDDLINLSSNTIYCYSLDNNGNRGGYYRLQSFGTMERQYTSGYNTYWEYVSAKGDNSNITFGQVGINSFDSVMLFLIFIVCSASFLFGRGKK